MTKTTATTTPEKQHKKQPARVSRAVIKRLANKAGARRVSQHAYDPIQQMYLGVAGATVRRAYTFMRHGKRKTLSAADVRAAIEAEGGRVYGCA